MTIILILLIKNSMNRAELVAALAERSGLQKQKASKVLEAYMEIVTEVLSANDEVTLIGFGTLSPRPQNSRMARNQNRRTCYDRGQKNS